MKATAEEQDKIRKDLFTLLKKKIKMISAVYGYFFFIYPGIHITQKNQLELFLVFWGFITFFFIFI